MVVTVAATRSFDRPPRKGFHQNGEPRPPRPSRYPRLHVQVAPSLCSLPRASTFAPNREDVRGGLDEPGRVATRWLGNLPLLERARGVSRKTEGNRVSRGPGNQKPGARRVARILRRRDPRVGLVEQPDGRRPVRAGGSARSSRALGPRASSSLHDGDGGEPDSPSLA
jgi:hypothetical protein